MSLLDQMKFRANHGVATGAVALFLEQSLLGVFFDMKIQAGSAMGAVVDGLFKGFPALDDF